MITLDLLTQELKHAQNGMEENWGKNEKPYLFFYAQAIKLQDLINAWFEGEE